MHNLPWTDLQELSFRSVCALRLQNVVIYQKWDSLEPLPTLNGIRLDVINRFTYPDSCLNNDGNICSEAEAQISKAPVIHANLLHLWRRGDISLSVKGDPYNAAIRSVLLWGVKHGHPTKKICTASCLIIAA